MDQAVRVGDVLPLGDPVACRRDNVDFGVLQGETEEEGGLEGGREREREGCWSRIKEERERERCWIRI